MDAQHSSLKLLNQRLMVDLRLQKAQHAKARAIEEHAVKKALSEEAIAEIALEEANICNESSSSELELSQVNLQIQRTET
eukprot:7057885-Karenia_brevis.AAC.1